MCWEVRCREERPWGQIRKEGFLVDRGVSLREAWEHQRDDEGRENGQSEGRIKVGIREMGAQ